MRPFYLFFSLLSLVSLIGCSLSGVVIQQVDINATQMAISQPPTIPPFPTTFLTPTPAPIVVELPANAGWVYTGLSLPLPQPGTVFITVSGSVDLCPGCEGSQPLTSYDTSGTCEETKAATEAKLNTSFDLDCMLGTAPSGAILARTGNGEPFWAHPSTVYSTYQSIFPSEGEIFLAVNDCCSLADNTGSYTVTIHIQPTSIDALNGLPIFGSAIELPWSFATISVDDFENQAYEGKLNSELWVAHGARARILQQNGKLAVMLIDPKSKDYARVNLVKANALRLDQYLDLVIQGTLRLSSETETAAGGYGSFGIGFTTPLERQDQVQHFECVLTREEQKKLKCEVFVKNNITGEITEYQEIASTPAEFGKDYFVRISINVNAKVNFTLPIASFHQKPGGGFDRYPTSTYEYVPNLPDEFRDNNFTPHIDIYSATEDSIIGYLDNVAIRARLKQ